MPSFLVKTSTLVFTLAFQAAEETSQIVINDYFLQSKLL